MTAAYRVCVRVLSTVRECERHECENRAEFSDAERFYDGPFVCVDHVTDKYTHERRWNGKGFGPPVYEVYPI